MSSPPLWKIPNLSIIQFQQLHARPPPVLLISWVPLALHQCWQPLATPCSLLPGITRGCTPGLPLRHPEFHRVQGQSKQPIHTPHLGVNTCFVPGAHSFQMVLWMSRRKRECTPVSSTDSRKTARPMETQEHAIPRPSLEGTGSKSSHLLYYFLSLYFTTY